MTELVVEAFINKDGQVIEPGEQVLYIATANKTTMFRKAKFKGVKYGNVTRTEYLRDENGVQLKEERKNPYTHQV